jgi:hypothetical protein
VTDPAATATPEFKLHDDVQVDTADWVARAAEVRTALAAEELPSTAMVDAMNAFRFLDDGGRTWTYNGTEWLSWNGAAWVASAPPASLKLLPFTLDAVPDAPDEPPAVLSTPMSEPAPEPAMAPAPELISAPGTAPEPSPAPEPVAATATPAPEPAPQTEPAPEPVAATPAPEPAPSLQPSPSPTPVPAAAPLQPIPPPIPLAPAWPTHVTPPTGLAAWAQPNPASPQVFLAPGLPVAVAEWTANGWARVVASNGWTGWVNGQALLPVTR